MSERRTEESRYLVLHDYGMGGLWWWVWARSAEEVVLTCAEVEVVSDPEALQRAEEWGLEEVRLDAPDPNPLSDLRAKREAQRGRPGFGALAGRDRVYLCWSEDGDDVRWLMELGPDGRWIRQVEVRPDGDRLKTTADDWPINPPMDLYDPQYVSMEISQTEFEQAWGEARPDPDV